MAALQQRTLIDGQEIYYAKMVRARLQMDGGFHARSFITGALLWVNGIDGDRVRVNYSMGTQEWMMKISNLKTL
jgi:hypothetical protein